MGSDIHLLMPADPLDERVVDDYFAAQWEALRAVGFRGSIGVSLDGEGERSGRLRGAIPDGARVVYRGWMLPIEGYRRLAEMVREAGGEMVTSPEAYRAAHHLPGWYERLRDLTPETHIVPLPEASPDLDAAAATIQALGWDQYFVKDYVKSLKVGRGAIVEPEEIGDLLREMQAHRGLLEGGVCARRVEAFVPDSEVRYLAFGGSRVFGPDPQQPIPHIATDAAARLGLPFVSIDVVQRTDGVLRIVEVGDGQVSDLVGWSVERFAQVLRMADDLGGRT